MCNEKAINNATSNTTEKEIDNLFDLPFGTKVKVVWNTSRRKDSYIGVIYGDMIGWEDGLCDEQGIIMESIYNKSCKAYLI